MSDEQAEILPGLRSDIEIVRTAGSGVPAWVIHDPLQHRYFQINDETRKLLEIWQPGATADQLISEVKFLHQIDIDENQIQGMVLFLKNNSLLIAAAEDTWRDYSQRSKAHNSGFFKKILHNYVFFKMPLFRPQTLLRSMLPLVAVFYSRLFLVGILVCAIVGTYLVSHQWDIFASNIQKFFTLEGAAVFGLALVFLKALHELGHAFTATRYGVQVPTMGVAFFLLTPLLYTDVSDAWRLRSRSQRLMISAAGIITELMVASIATLCWAFLPDGTARDVALVLASTGWIVSLTINLNPLIKFDGYYLLSDLISVDNLQQRSFALGKWKLRELIFSPNQNVPEIFSPPMQRWLIILAWLTWAYRVVLFTTIALVVYHFAFKLLGIVLLILEIWLLVARPIIAEIRQWHSIGIANASRNRIVLTSSLILIVTLTFFTPWSTRITIPALLQAENVSVIYPGSAALVKSVNIKRGQTVLSGMILAELEDPQLLDKINAARINIESMNKRISNSVIAQLGGEELLVLRQSIKFEQSKLEGLLKQKQELVLLAPASGIVRELNPDIHVGRWIQKTDYVASIITGNAQILKGYIAQSDLTRLKIDAIGRFIPDDLTRASLPVRLDSIARSGASVIEIASLASTNGGRVAVDINEQNQLVPQIGQNLVKLELLVNTNIPIQMVRGVVDIRGEPKSLFASTWNQIAKIIIRETGF